MKFVQIISFIKRRAIINVDEDIIEELCSVWTLKSLYELVD